jgi:hypothetical protein
MDSTSYIDLIRLPLPVQRCESNTSASRWIPPPPGVSMVNADAVIFQAQGKMAQE